MEWTPAGPAGGLLDAAAVTASGGREKSGEPKNEKDLKIPRSSSVVLASLALPHLPACQNPTLLVDNKSDKVLCSGPVADEP